MWTQEEDLLLTSLVKKHGKKNWKMIAESIPGRSGKQVRDSVAVLGCSVVNDGVTIWTRLLRSRRGLQKKI